MSRRKPERTCEACGQTFLARPANARTCSAACQQHLRRKPATDSGSHRDRTGQTPGAGSTEPWTGRTLYSVPRTPPFLVVGRPVLAETERLIFASNGALGDWENGARLAAVFEKPHLQASGTAGAYSDFGTVFLRLEDAQAHSARRLAEEQARLAREMRREQERERQRERQRKRERRSNSRARRDWEPQEPGAADPDPRQCFKRLGLSWPCSVEDVKLAFRKLAHQHHPDKGGSTTAFIALREAYLDAVNWCLTEQRR